MKTFGMNQKMLAKHAGKSDAIISRLLSGQVKRITPDLLDGLAHTFKTDPRELAKTLRELSETGDELPESDKGDQANPPLIDVAMLPTDSQYFCGREEQLVRLNQAWRRQLPHIICVIGEGGVGKTSLVAHWNAQMAREDYRGAKRVYAFSFYEFDRTHEGKDEPPSADHFLQKVSKWMGLTAVANAEDNAKRLAQEFQKQKTLLILDGLEILQKMPGDGMGRFKEPAMRYFLREMASYTKGLCVLTSRLPITDLNAFLGNTVEEIRLDGLTTEEGSALIERILADRPHESLTSENRRQHSDSHEDKAEELNRQEVLEEVVAEMDGHGLALTLFATYLRDVLRGDLSRRDQIASLLDEPSAGAHARRMLESYKAHYESSGEEAMVCVLHMISLFSIQVSLSTLEELRRKQVPYLTLLLRKKTDTEWRIMLSKLDRCRLIKFVENKNRPGIELIEMHPLVRAYFADDLKSNHPVAWKKGHYAVYEIYRDFTARAQKKLGHLTDRSLTHAMRGIYHAALIEHYAEAYQLYYETRHDDRHKNKFEQPLVISSYGIDKEALSMFYIKPWTELVNDLGEVEQAWLLQQTSQTLIALGDMRSAYEAILKSIEMTKAWLDREGTRPKGIEDNRVLYRYAAQRLGILGRIQQSEGELEAALASVKQGCLYAKESQDLFQREARFAQLGAVLHQMGRRDEARKAFEDAAGFHKMRNVTKKKRLKSEKLQLIQAFYYLEFLFEEKQYDKMIEHLKEVGQLSMRVYEHDLARARYNLLFGMAYLGKYTQGEETARLAEKYLLQGIEGVEKAGIRWMFPIAYLMHERFLRETEDSRSWLRLERIMDAYRIAKSCGLKLAEIDCLIAFAHYDMDVVKNFEYADNNVQQISKLIFQTGYERYRGELEDLGRKLQQRRK